MKILLDLDGVLVDFAGGVKKICPDLDMPVGQWWKMEPEHWAKCDYNFWKNLQWLPKGQLILDTVEWLFPNKHITICTSPCATPGCAEGKIEWIRTHIPAYKRKYAICPCKEGLASQQHLLIDDSLDNIEKFVAAGGYGFLVPGTNNFLHDVEITKEYLVDNLYRFTRL